MNVEIFGTIIKCSIASLALHRIWKKKPWLIEFVHPCTLYKNIHKGNYSRSTSGSRTVGHSTKEWFTICSPALQMTSSGFGITCTIHFWGTKSAILQAQNMSLQWTCSIRLPQIQYNEKHKTWLVLLEKLQSDLWFIYTNRLLFHWFILAIPERRKQTNRP